MPPIEKRDIWFNSSDGVNEVAGVLYHCPERPPFCVLQISHGMCEYMGRYEDFARYLAGCGVAVCGHDHLGHGATARHSDDYGYFTQKGGRLFVLKDLHTMNQKAREAFPGLPLTLLGHSMGSFYARKYASLWPNSIDALILSGTAGKNPLAGAGIAITRALTAIYGGRHRSALVEGMAFGSYLSHIKNPRTKHDWVSRDEEVVNQYATDPLCTFRFTLNGFHELFSILREVSGPDWAISLPKNLPVWLFAGAEDPVGNYGKGVKQVYGWLRGAGLTEVSCTLYPGGRHEMLNEIDRNIVYADVLRFLQSHFAPQELAPTQTE